MEERIVSIHQPNLFPRLKVLQKIAASNVYIVYDDVQFVRNDWQNRVLIRHLSLNEPFWVCIPVNKPNGRNSKINEVTIAECEKTFTKIRRQFSLAYSRSLYWNEIEELLSKMLSYDFFNLNLSDYLFYTIKCILDYFSIKPQLIRSFSFKEEMPKEKNMHLITLCNLTAGNTYICGSGGLSYIDEDVFKDHGINILIQNWKEAEMEAAFGAMDWKNISFIDFWARFGTEAVKDILLSNKTFSINKGKEG